MLPGCTPREQSCSGSRGLRGAASRFGLSRSTLPNGPETEKILGVNWVEEEQVTFIAEMAVE